MRRKRVVAFSGHKGSGKSHLAKYLKEEKGYHVLSYAGALKEALIAVYGHAPHFYLPDLKEIQHPNSQHTPRRLMQATGDFFRSLDSDVFATSILQKIEAHELVAIDDLRFNNEAKVLIDYCATHNHHLNIVKIETDIIQDDMHISELGISSTYANSVIFNDRSLGAKELIDKYKITI